MVKAMPDNVKDMLSSLTGQQQVTLRAYIASLREEIKELEAKVAATSDPDPHAHYHGHEKCTADHAHGHDHKEETACTESHDHSTEHCNDEGHSHEHSHAAKQDSRDHHAHSHKEPEHAHEHGHDDDMPAWKKKALEADPMAAPFGGNWNTEASVSATDDSKMKE
jgi:hypothetical protein